MKKTSFIIAFMAFSAVALANGVGLLPVEVGENGDTSCVYPCFSDNKINMNLPIKVGFLAMMEPLGTCSLFHQLSLSSSNNEKADRWYTRGKGFVIRPESNTSLSIDVGYQINPVVQVYVGTGWYFGLETSIGARAYVSDTKWSLMYELRISGVNRDFSYFNPSASVHKYVYISLIDGASYKDFDFGAGPMLVFLNGELYSINCAITIGYNIRCYKHRFPRLSEYGD